jgi:hypothetical protein
MTAMFYDSMRALGPLTLDEVPEAVAAQIVGGGNPMMGGGGVAPTSTLPTLLKN